MQANEAGISGDPPPEAIEISGEPLPETIEISGEPQSDPLEVFSSAPQDPAGISGGAYTMGDQREIMKALETVERDSVAIAESFASLFSSLRLGLAEVLHFFSIYPVPIFFSCMSIIVEIRT